MSANLEFRSHMTVELVDCMGTDFSIARAARVSTGRDRTESGTEADAGLINYLMKNRHGSPFEHNSMTFYVEAPIFVWREFMRHRVGWSYNETSARYRALEPVFYVPFPHRKLRQEGSSAHPKLVEGTREQHYVVEANFKRICREAYESYQSMLDYGIAKEVARSVLPVNTYSSAYVTCNARSLMSFLSLRTHNPFATFVSHPQAEIELVARQMEEIFTDLFPATAHSFQQNGRVAP